MRKKLSIVGLLAAAALTLVCAACVIAYFVTSGRLDSQKAAERWQGESEQSFSQVSCFIPVDRRVSLNEIYRFRNELQKRFREAALDDSEEKLFNDAWCTTGTVRISRLGGGSGEVGVIAVGGSFFDFHPIRLISGAYISQDDLMQDRVLLDEECAWLLYGGTELSGLNVDINGQHFVVAGVIRREEDKFTRRAYSDGMGIYMSYDTYASLMLGGTTEGETAVNVAAVDGVSCYELVMADPVKGFAYSTVTDKFPAKDAEVIENSTRFDASRLLKASLHPGLRTLQTKGVALPYWENAARLCESRCMLLLVVAVFSAIYPIGFVTWLLIGLGKHGADKLREDIVPDRKEKLSEWVRQRQRRRWEKQHPGWRG